MTPPTDLVGLALAESLLERWPTSGGLMALSYAEAEGLQAAGPFSFEDRWGTKVSAFIVCARWVTIPANAVDVNEWGSYRLLVPGWMWAGAGARIGSLTQGGKQ